MLAIKKNSALAFLAGVLFASHMPGPSQGSAAGQDIPKHDAAAVIKLVTVSVLGEDGRLVASLRKEDFVLFDNGGKRTSPGSKCTPSVILAPRSSRPIEFPNWPGRRRGQTGASSFSRTFREVISTA
jgi:hypothetical protein